MQVSFLQVEPDHSVIRRIFEADDTLVQSAGNLLQEGKKADRHIRVSEKALA